MDGAIPSFGLLWPPAFVRAALRYWLRVFPRVARELRRRRQLALAIPDPVLRRIALQALECKRCNQEGAATFELLGRRRTRARLVRALCACQALCDYLDLLAEQPAEDRVANGYRLHEALIAAVDCDAAPAGDASAGAASAGAASAAATPAGAAPAGATPADATPADAAYYYAHCPTGERDGGYLQTLIDDVRGVLAGLPARAEVQAPLRRAALRIAEYQSFNHGDNNDGAGASHGASHECLMRWADEPPVCHGSLWWWEAAAGAGSTLLLFALMARASHAKLAANETRLVEDAYLPWFGALHTLLDSLVDLEEDRATEGHRLIAHYESAGQAAERMRLIAREALVRARALPAGRRHGLLLVAMSGFYLSQAPPADAPVAGRVRGALLAELGGLARTAMLMVGVRHAARRSASERAAVSVPSCRR